MALEKIFNRNKLLSLIIWKEKLFLNKEERIEIRFERKWQMGRLCVNAMEGAKRSKYQGPDWQVWQIMFVFAGRVSSSLSSSSGPRHIALYCYILRTILLNTFTFDSRGGKEKKKFWSGGFVVYFYNI